MKLDNSFVEDSFEKMTQVLQYSSAPEIDVSCASNNMDFKWENCMEIMIKYFNPKKPHKIYNTI